ncbi:alkaline shock response membrane anchor protein AmaP [Saccharomonospora cyanea]|uniref:DUF6286 domain-containing protein n=1 Tax=Saccharomonospora cyanea NA-134 TaxID=882082 RepID=H5XEG8_9PSEU|nr:alkaline shock response membrane anchor protein AmaP [Saccharomonospora cyanea]EHR61436.1 hypothetical protein SaccyDRAFT_2577 [Saccharomonospora cyanea NA-134]
MRLLNRLLATLLCLALIAGSVLVIAEVIAALLDRGPAVWDWRATQRWADDTVWQDVVVRIVCVALLVVGLVLLVAEVKRPRLRRLPVDHGAEADSGVRPVDTAYTRRGVAAAVRSAVAEVDGIRAARVKVKRRAVKVSATTGSHNKAMVRQLDRTVTEAARESLRRLQLRSAPSVSARTRSA